jgi:pyrimidine-nucleoside phosphorylase
VASCGVAVPMMSGRGLGHTGGTLDKLESIPGFRTALSLKEAKAQVERIGCAMLGQTPEIAPADKRLYALRDVTGTVESIPLIAASIMSKKLAEGLNGLVLDVKTGSGAFLPGEAQALELARTMIGLGEARGCPTVALLTAMDRPLGRSCGNALEVEEAIEGLQGAGPADLMEVTYALAIDMLLLVGAADDTADARRRLQESVSSGRALETFGRVIEAQGGDPRVLEDPALLPQAAEVEVFRASRDGVVVQVEPRRVGRAILELGGGRQTIEEEIEPSVGFVIPAKPGDRVKAGEPLASVFAGNREGINTGLQALREAIVIGDEGSLTPLITHRVTSSGVEALI